MDRDASFKILGLTSDASLKEIKRAYRDLVKVWHPDRYSDDSALKPIATENLKMGLEAYHHLLKLHQEGTLYLRPETPKPPPLEREPPQAQAPRAPPPGPVRKLRMAWQRIKGFRLPKPQAWLWCLVPVFGLPRIRLLQRKGYVFPPRAVRGLMIAFLSALFGFFLLELPLGHQMVSGLLYLGALGWFLFQNKRIHEATAVQTTALLLQVNILFTLLALFLMLRLVVVAV